MASAHDILSVLLPVLVGIALIGIAVVVLRHGQGHRHNLSFGALYILSGLKSVSDGLGLVPDHVLGDTSLFPQALFWQFLALFCGIGLFPMLVLFLASFPRPAKWLQARPWLAAVPFVPSVLMAAIVFLVVRGEVHPAWFSSGNRAFNYLLVAATVGALAWLARVRSRSPDPVERKQATYVLLGFLPAFVLGWVITAVQEAARGGALDADQASAAVANILHFVSPLLELVAGSLVAFAILKYNILGIDPKFRLGVKSVAVGLIFALIFLATQAIENLVLQGRVFSFLDDFTAGTGSFIMSGVAGLVLFKPIERASNRISNKLLPSQEVSAGSKHAEEIYHAQASYVLRDAKVTDRELQFLRNLRVQLGLTDATARRIEEDVERLLEVDDPRIGQRAVGAGSAPSWTGVAVARRQAEDVAQGDLQVRRAARAPPAPRSPPAAPPTGTPRPASAKPGTAVGPRPAKAPAPPAAPSAKPSEKASGAGAKPAEKGGPRPPTTGKAPPRTGGT